MSLSTVSDPLVQRLMEIQEQRGMNSRQFAAQLGVDYTTWWRLRTGGIDRVSRDVLEQAFRAFPELLIHYVRELQVCSD